MSIPNADVFKALADPSRREILKRLRDGPLSAGRLADGLGISKPAVSQHLNVLKAADLVAVEKQGQFQVYSLNVTVVEEVMAAILGLLPPRLGASDTGVAYE